MFCVKLHLGTLRGGKGCPEALHGGGIWALLAREPQKRPPRLPFRTPLRPVCDQNTGRGQMPVTGATVAVTRLVTENQGVTTRVLLPGAALPLALCGSWGAARRWGGCVWSRIDMQNVLGGKESHLPQNLVIGAAAIANASPLQDSRTSDPTRRGDSELQCVPTARPHPRPRCLHSVLGDRSRPKVTDRAPTACCSVMAGPSAPINTVASRFVCSTFDPEE